MTKTQAHPDGGSRAEGPLLLSPTAAALRAKRRVRPRGGRHIPCMCSDCRLVRGLASRVIEPPTPDTAERDRLRQENAELREALERVLDAYMEERAKLLWAIVSGNISQADAKHAVSIKHQARAALDRSQP